MPTGHIKDIEQGYKCLGVLQSYNNHDAEMREKARTEYRKRVRQVLRSHLNGQNVMSAINAYAIPVIRYSAGIIAWPKEEMQQMDVKTRKLLTLHGALHPKSSSCRLYVCRKDGGRGLQSVEGTIKDEEAKMRSYCLERSEVDPILKECLRDWDQVQVVDLEDWRTKKLHGEYHRQIEKVADIGMTYRWLTTSSLNTNTEALIMAAQEQALNTRSIQAGIDHTIQDGRCRLCKQATESVQHIVSGCSQLASKAYTERHNQVANIVHRAICNRYGLLQPTDWWEIPEKVVENDQAKVLWDFYLHTDKQVIANRPDIVVVDKINRTTTIIDIAVPSDFNIKVKEIEKVEKYQALREELERTWRTTAVVVPVVVGALGAVTPNCTQWLAQIPGEIEVHWLQKSALLGTGKILRRFLKLPGFW